MSGQDSSYADDGVNIRQGDSFSSYAARVCRGTYKTLSQFVEVEDLSGGRFRGPRGFRLRGLPDGCLSTLAGDGVGTKGIVIVASGQLHTAASNVIAMTAMDITRFGGFPLVFANILDVASLGEEGSETHRMSLEVMRGLAEIAHECKYVVLTGESAELGVCVSSEDPNARFKFNWAGVMYGVYHRDKMILGQTLAPGQVIIALRDDFRSNGFSSVRSGFRIHYGDEWYRCPEALPDIIAAAAASAQYDRFLNHLHGWMRTDGGQLEPLVKMHSIVHLSGGAFESKLGDDVLVPRGLSAYFDNLFDPPEIMRKCVKWRGLSGRESYSVLNGGQGALVVIDEGDVDVFLCHASAFGVEAKVAGRIEPKQGYTIKIDSRFDGSVVEF